jgi:alpha/beta superfamily hydrolase
MHHVCFSCSRYYRRYGLLDAGKVQIRIILHVNKDGENYSATLDSPDQGANGIGVLRYDDRGTAESTGDFQIATSADFSTDVEAALEYLKSREDLKGVEIGLMGHSEGGMIAPMVAARNEKVDFVILLAGPSVSNDKLLLKQKKYIAEAVKLPEKMVTYDQECGKRVFDFIKQNKELDEADFKNGLAEIVKNNVADHNPMLKGGKPDSEVVESELQQYLSPWFRYFISYDPMENIASIKCPVLAINRTLDLQVSNDENLAAIENALKKGKNENYKISSHKGLNHLFQTAETGDVSEYGKIEETVNEDVILEVLKWIEEL